METIESGTAYRLTEICEAAQCPPARTPHDWAAHRSALGAITARNLCELVEYKRILKELGLLELIEEARRAAAARDRLAAVSTAAYLKDRLGFEWAVKRRS